MSIIATFFETHCEVIVPDSELKRFHADILPKDRFYHQDKKLWIVKRVEQYAHLEYIWHALQANKLQLKLPFGDLV